MLIALVLHVRLVVGGAHLDADPAAGAVVGRHLDRHPAPGSSRSFHSLWSEAVGGVGRHVGVEDLHPDRAVRAHERALRAVDADRRVPDRDLARDRSLLPTGGVGGEGAVDREGRDRQEIALAGEHGGRDPLHERGGLGGHGRPLDGGRSSAGDGTAHLVQRRDRAVDGREVARRSPSRPACRRSSTIASLIASIASSIGRISVSAKKQVCRTVLMRVPSPASLATA